MLEVGNFIDYLRKGRSGELDLDIVANYQIAGIAA